MRNPRVRLWLIVTQAIYIVSLLPWLMMAGLSLMAFDSPAPEGSPLPWLLLISVWSYPLLPVTCALLAWLAYWRRKELTAIVLTTVPLILAVPLVAYLVYAMA